MPHDPVRQRLSTLVAESGVSLAWLSHLIGRNAAYLQQYLQRGTPRVLGDTDRRHLAIYFDVDERDLGACEPWMPAA